MLGLRLGGGLCGNEPDLLAVNSSLLGLLVIGPGVVLDCTFLMATLLVAAILVCGMRDQRLRSPALLSGRSISRPLDPQQPGRR